MKFSLSDAVASLYPNAEFVIIGENLDGLTFIKPADNSIPSKSEIDNALKKLENDYDNARIAAENKLTALGLTKEDLRALGIG